MWYILNLYSFSNVIVIENYRGVPIIQLFKILVPLGPKKTTNQTKGKIRKFHIDSWVWAKVQPVIFSEIIFQPEPSAAELLVTVQFLFHPTSHTPLLPYTTLDSLIFSKIRQGSCS